MQKLPGNFCISFRSNPRPRTSTAACFLCLNPNAVSSGFTLVMLKNCEKLFTNSGQFKNTKKPI